MTRRGVAWAVVAVALIAAALFVLWREQSSGTAPARLGERLLPAFPAADVAKVVITRGKDRATLVRGSGGAWTVEERGYPAEEDRVRDLLLKMRELKIAQVEPVAAAQRPRLELADPGAEGGATQVEFFDAAGKSVGQLLVGKAYLRRAGADTAGVPAGRYVLVKGDETSALMVGDTLPDLVAQPVPWLARAFLRIDRARSVSVAGPDGAPLWAIERDSDQGRWRFSDSRPGAPDEAKANQVARVFEAMGFTDVVGPMSAHAGKLDGASTVTITTFDGFRYEAKIGGPATPEQRHFAVTVAGTPPAARTPAPDEKAEDLEKLDQAFAERAKQLEERLAREKGFEQWVYLVSTRVVEALLQPRDRLLPEKPKPEEGAEAPKKG